MAVIYDAQTDQWRDVTQADVDELLRIKAAYAALLLERHREPPRGD